MKYIILFLWLLIPTMLACLLYLTIINFGTNTLIINIFSIFGCTCAGLSTIVSGVVLFKEFNDL